MRHAFNTCLKIPKAVMSFPGTMWKYTWKNILGIAIKSKQCIAVMVFSEPEKEDKGYYKFRTSGGPSFI